MAQQTVDPKKIKTLANWVANWHKATNLGFDPETREPTIYDTTKERTKLSSIPWKREVDILTVLTQPARFSSNAVGTATARYAKFREQKGQMRSAGEEQLRLAEAVLLDAWRSYNAAPAAARAALRHDILVADSAVRQIEFAMADKSRVTYKNDNGGIAVYVPPISAKRRGLTVEEAI